MEKRKKGLISFSGLKDNMHFSFCLKIWGLFGLFPVDRPSQIHSIEDIRKAVLQKWYWEQNEAEASSVTDTVIHVEHS